MQAEFYNQKIKTGLAAMNNHSSRGGSKNRSQNNAIGSQCSEDLHNPAANMPLSGLSSLHGRCLRPPSGSHLHLPDPPELNVLLPEQHHTSPPLSQDHHHKVFNRVRPE